MKKKIVSFIGLTILIAMICTSMVSAEVLCDTCKSTTTLISTDSTYWYKHHQCWDPTHYTPNVSECWVWYKDFTKTYLCDNDFEELLGLTCTDTTTIIYDRWVDHAEEGIQ